MTPDHLTDAIARLQAWIRDYGAEKQPAFIADLMAVLEELSRLRAERDPVRVVIQRPDGTETHLTDEQLSHVREARTTVDVIEGLERENAVNREALVSIQTFCNGANDACLRGFIQEVLDNTSWLHEDYSRFVSQSTDYAALLSENAALRAALDGAIVDYDKCPYQMATEEIERLRLVHVPESPGFFYVLDRQAVNDICRVSLHRLTEASNGRTA